MSNGKRIGALTCEERGERAARKQTGMLCHPLLPLYLSEIGGINMKSFEWVCKKGYPVAK
jgi:hypothetical protein